MDLNKKRENNIPHLIDELMDKWNDIQLLRKLLKIRTKTRKDNNSNSHKGDFHSISRCIHVYKMVRDFVQGLEKEIKTS